jgi:hypothetical protein
MAPGPFIHLAPSLIRLDWEPSARGDPVTNLERFEAHRKAMVELIDAEVDVDCMDAMVDDLKALAKKATEKYNNLCDKEEA